MLDTLRAQGVWRLRRTVRSCLCCRQAGVTLRAPREASDLPGRERQVEALELMAHLSHQEASVSVQSSEVTTREDGQSISLKLAGITDEIVKKRNTNF